MNLDFINGRHNQHHKLFSDAISKNRENTTNYSNVGKLNSQSFPYQAGDSHLVLNRYVETLPTDMNNQRTSNPFFNEKVGAEAAYLAILEGNLGKMRLENERIKEYAGDLERKVEFLNDKNIKMEEKANLLATEAREVGELRTKVMQNEFERLAIESELSTRKEIEVKLRKREFELRFEKSAYDSALRENSNLREHVSHLTNSLDSLKESFDQFVKIFPQSPEEIRERQNNEKFYENSRLLEVVGFQVDG